MTPSQSRFLAMHRRRRDPPTDWRWKMGGEYVQAVTRCGDTATISIDEFDQLVTDGQLVWIPGMSRIGVPSGDSNVVSLRALAAADGGAV